MASRSASRLDFLRYSVTTLEPGASEVFTQGLDVRPFVWALRARRPAATSTAGLEVLVQLVMAAITTAPSLSSKSLPSCFTLAGPADLRVAWSLSKALLKFLGMSPRSTRSWGRFGPAREGLMLPRSSDSTSVYTASCPSRRHMPWALA